MRKIGFLALASVLATQVLASTPETIKNDLMQKTGLVADSVVKAPIDGIWEVAIAGRILYVDDLVKHVIHQGHIIDLDTNKDLTQERVIELARDKWKSLPFEDAVKQVFGKGERRLVVFSDANCGYCKQLERTFEEVGNLTVFTFIVPAIRGYENNREIVCSKDRTVAWSDWMAKGIAPNPAPTDCDISVLDRNYKLFQQFGFNGAPALFFENGKKATGSMSAEQLDMLLNEK